MSNFTLFILDILAGGFFRQNHFDHFLLLGVLSLKQYFDFHRLQKSSVHTLEGEGRDGVRLEKR